jgi:tetratricopeptide (TPR) repeat protein
MLEPRTDAPEKPDIPPVLPDGAEVAPPARRPHRLRQDRSARATARALVCLCIVAAPLALGGAHPEVNATLAGILCVAWLAWLRSDRTPDVAAPLSLAVGLAAAATVLQLVPLPVALLAYVAPGTHAVRSLGEAHWVPLSLDAPGTTHELLKLLAYLMASWLAADLFRSRRRILLLLKAVVTAGVLVAAIGYVQLALDVRQPYATFGRPGAGLVSTFINPNHLAGYMGLASFAALGLAQELYRRGRAAACIAASACGGAVLLTMSRGGILALAAAGIVLLATEGWRRSTRDTHFHFWAAPLAGAVLLGCALGYTQLVHELWTLGNADAFFKVSLWRQVPTMLADFPLFGLGRGTFFSVYERYRTDSAPVTFTHLENEWLQALVDLGPLVGVAVIALLGAALWRLRTPADMPSRSCVAAGMVFLALQNLGDFSLELTGVALPAVVLLAAYGTPRTRPRGARLARRQSIAMAVVPCALILLAAPYAIAYASSRDTTALTAALQNPGASFARRRAVAEATMARHPADYYLPLIMAESALHTPAGLPVALRYINRSMYLAPRAPEPHRLAGQALFRQGAGAQALLELRLACELDPSLTPAVAAQVFGITGSVENVRVLASTPATRVALARYLLERQAPQEAEDLLPEDLQRHDPAAALLAAQAALEAHRPADCIAATRAARALWPSLPGFVVLEARAHLALGNADTAVSVLRVAAVDSGAVQSIAPHLASYFIDARRFDEARRVAHDLLRRGGNPAAAHQILGRAFDAEGRAWEALREYEQARTQAPSSGPLRLSVARLRERLGDLRGAVRELEDGRLRADATEALDAELTRVRKTLRDRELAEEQRAYLGEGESP